jgi:hypothetical protein
MDRHLVGQHLGELAHRAVLSSREVLGQLRRDEVGPADGAVEHRAAREHGDRPSLGVAERVREVGRGVAGGVQGRDPHGARGQLVAVADAHRRDVEVVVGGEHVGGTEPLGERGAARDVVVVDVRLEHVGDGQAAGRDQVEHPVEVALRIDDDGDLTVGRQVAAVPQGGGLDGEDLDHGLSPSR